LPGLASNSDLPDLCLLSTRIITTGAQLRNIFLTDCFLSAYCVAGIIGVSHLTWPIFTIFKLSGLFLLLSFQSSLYILNNSLTSDISSANIFS
jgi:hypothetical protein